MKKYLYAFILLLGTVVTSLATEGDLSLTRKNASNVWKQTDVTVLGANGVMMYNNSTKLPLWMSYVDFASNVLDGASLNDISFTSTVNAAAASKIALPIADSPTTSSAGYMAFKRHAWATDRGAIQLYDGTANTYVLGVLASDTPSDGQYPRWNTGGTLTWETVSGSGDMLLGTIQTVTAAKTFNVGTLLLDDSDSAFNLILGSTSTVTSANKTLTFDVNDADRTLTIGSSTTLSGGTHSGTNTGDVTLGGENYLGIAGQVITAASINLSGTHVTNTLPVAKGGTGLTAGTSGGVLGYTATGTLASSGALGVGNIVIGGGAGAVPTSVTAGATTEILVGGGAATAPVWTTASGSGAPLRQTSPAIVSPTITTGIEPTTDDGAALGNATTKRFSDLFLMEGGVINWDNGDATLTQTSNVVLLAGATLETSTVGTAANSVATIDGAQTFTNKTLDASATGNVVKMFGYLVLTHPHVFGAGVTQQTTVTNNQYGQALFSNSVDKATNYVEYYLVIPPDVDTAIDLTATFKIQLSAGDTGDHEYEISFDSVANSAAYAGSLGDPISLAYTADGSGAANDVETAGETTLTGWRSAMTAGQLMVVRVARDGDHASDTSTVNSYSGPLVIKYPITQ